VRGSGKPANRVAELMQGADLDPADIKRIEDSWDWRDASAAAAAYAGFSCGRGARARAQSRWGT
jgi:hypothetical protein